MWVHRLSNIDAESRTATCTNCGPVSIRRHSGGHWRCNVARAMAEAGVQEVRPRLERCEICGDAGTTLDHDHSTGLFRGWLCRRCNLLLGVAKDNPSLLDIAARYLRQPSSL